MLVVKHRQEVCVHGGVSLPALPLLLENGVRTSSVSNIDCGFTTLNLQGASLGDMEIEEAVIVGLLAVGMSILVALTVMLIW